MSKQEKYPVLVDEDHSLHGCEIGGIVYWGPFCTPLRVTGETRHTWCVEEISGFTLTDPSVREEGKEVAKSHPGYFVSAEECISWHRTDARKKFESAERQLLGMLKVIPPMIEGL
jgi:hypothetical protein